MDIVPSLVAHLQRTIGDEHTMFVATDVTALDALPKTQLIFSRQMTQHLWRAAARAPASLSAR